MFPFLLSEIPISISFVTTHVSDNRNSRNNTKKTDSSRNLKDTYWLTIML